MADIVPSATLDQRIRALAPLRFQRLVIALARREYGLHLEEVRDTDGEGNGCDGLLDMGPGLHAFQARTFEHRIGDTQKAGIRKAIHDAAITLPAQRVKSLLRMTFIFNTDLSPSESGWFATQQEKARAELKADLDYHGLSWVMDRLLRNDNDSLRREYVETEFDRQTTIVHLLEELRTQGSAARHATEEELREQILKEVRGLKADASLVNALASLMERAHHHYTSALKQIDDNYFDKAIEFLNEAKQLLIRHQDDPLYRDIEYWRGVALQGASRWQEAFEAFATAQDAYRRVGLEDEAHYAEGNRGHSLHSLGRISEALDVFRLQQNYWIQHDDQLNYCRGHVNIAMALRSLGRPSEALDVINEGLATLQNFAPDPQSFLANYELACSLAGISATIYWELDDPMQSLTQIDSTIPVAKAAGDEYLTAKLLAQSSQPLRDLGRLHEAEERLREAERVFEARSDRLNLSIVYNNRAINALERGSPNEALQLLEKDANLCRQIGDTHGLKKTLDLISQIRGR